MGGLWSHSGTGEWDPLPDVGYFGEFSISDSFKKSAFVGGGYIGYNWQFAPTWVAGIEGDWSWTDANASFTHTWVNIISGLRPGASLA